MPQRDASCAARSLLLPGTRKYESDTKWILYLLAHCSSCINSMAQLTWDLLEDNVAHEFLKAVGVETRPVHRYSVLKKRTKVTHVFSGTASTFVSRFDLTPS